MLQKTFRFLLGIVLALFFLAAYASLAYAEDDPELISTITVTKIDAKTSNGLEGATFTLTGTSDNGESISQEKITDSNGIAVFQDIPIGTYTVTESKAPEGYEIANPASKQVSIEGLVASIEGGLVYSVRASGRTDVPYYGKFYFESQPTYTNTPSTVVSVHTDHGDVYCDSQDNYGEPVESGAFIGELSVNVTSYDFKPYLIDSLTVTLPAKDGATGTVPYRLEKQVAQPATIEFSNNKTTEQDETDTKDSDTDTPSQDDSTKKSPDDTNKDPDSSKQDETDTKDSDTDTPSQDDSTKESSENTDKESDSSKSTASGSTKASDPKNETAGASNTNGASSTAARQTPQTADGLLPIELVLVLLLCISGIGVMSAGREIYAGLLKVFK